MNMISICFGGIVEKMKEQRGEWINEKEQ